VTVAVCALGRGESMVWCRQLCWGVTAWCDLEVSRDVGTRGSRVCSEGVRDRSIRRVWRNSWILMPSGLEPDCRNDAPDHESLEMWLRTVDAAIACWGLTPWFANFSNGRRGRCSVRQRGKLIAERYEEDGMGEDEIEIHHPEDGNQCSLKKETEYRAACNAHNLVSYTSILLM
jgi:hypothetical protein